MGATIRESSSKELCYRLRKVDANKTSISVNSQFNLKFDISTSAYVYPRGQVYGKDNLNMDWTSGETGRFGEINKTEGVSTFSLEFSILDLAK